MNRRQVSIRAWMAIVAALLLGGCRGVDAPNVFDPGPPGYQRYTMERFDPMPTTEGAPNLEGARPREYLTPVPEPRRSRWDPRGWFGF